MTTFDQNSVRHMGNIGKEATFLVTNLVGCVVLFSTTWLILRRPLGSPRGEVMNDLLFTLLDYVPVFFIVLYAPLRLLGHRSSALPTPIGRLLRSAWALGPILGIILALVDRYTSVFSIWKPFVGA